MPSIAPEEMPEVNLEWPVIAFPYVPLCTSAQYFVGGTLTQNSRSHEMTPFLIIDIIFHTLSALALNYHVDPLNRVQQHRW